MLGNQKPKPVSEHEADGEIERIYHEIRQMLRVNGVNLNFRTWAGLILWGRDDKFQVLKYGERLARDIPGAELIPLPDARHFLMFDQRERVSSHLLAFLRPGA